MADLKQEKAKAQVDAINTNKVYKVNVCKAVYGVEAAEAVGRLRTTSSLSFRLRDWFGDEAKKDTERAIWAGQKETNCIAKAETEAQMELAKLNHPKRNQAEEATAKAIRNQVEDATAKVIVNVKARQSDTEAEKGAVKTISGEEAQASVVRKLSTGKTSK
jgi:hypothetical protein